MATPMTQDEKTRQGSQDAGQYFRYMTEFVGFTPADAEAIHQSALIVEKYLPSIVADFYTHLLRYPPTRKFFLKPDGTVDQDYVQVRMHHLTNFWRRTAGGVYDDDYARYVDYVGHAHTARGADPGIYIAERYVIGQVGFMQRAISAALEKELHGIDDDLERRAVRAWNLLMMVILELLARAYGDEHEGEASDRPFIVNPDEIQELAVDTYERGLGLVRPQKTREIWVGKVEEIPEGERKIVQVDNLSIGVFHHKGNWYSLLNYCLHRGGPVATGCLEGDVLTCPWHGFQYDVTTGQMLKDSTARLSMYPVEVREDGVYLVIPEKISTAPTITPTHPAAPQPAAAPKSDQETKPKLNRNELYLSELPPGKTGLVAVEGRSVAVYNVDGEIYATQSECTHVGGPLNEGKLTGATIVCPWHGSCFDVRTGDVQCGPAQVKVKTYAVTVSDGVIRVEA